MLRLAAHANLVLGAKLFDHPPSIQVNAPDPRPVQRQHRAACAEHLRLHACDALSQLEARNEIPKQRQAIASVCNLRRRRQLQRRFAGHLVGRKELHPVDRIATDVAQQRKRIGAEDLADAFNPFSALPIAISISFDPLPADSKLNRRWGCRASLGSASSRSNLLSDTLYSSASLTSCSGLGLRISSSIEMKVGAAHI